MCLQKFFSLILCIVFTVSEAKAGALPVHEVIEQAEAVARPALTLIESNPNADVGAGTLFFGGIALLGAYPVIVGTIGIITLIGGGYEIWEYTQDQRLKREKWKKLDPKEVFQALEDCRSGRRICQYGMQANGEFIPYIPRSEVFGTMQFPPRPPAPR